MKKFVLGAILGCCLTLLSWNYLTDYKGLPNDVSIKATEALKKKTGVEGLVMNGYKNEGGSFFRKTWSILH